MKKVSVILIFVLVAMLQVSGQVPQKFNYQAVVRNSDGTVMASQVLSVFVQLHKVSATGEVIYSETHTPTTSPQGVINLVIGDGTVKSSDFASIPWAENIFIQVDIKKPSDASYQSLGTTQILSVPYALSAGSVKQVVSDASSTDDAIFEVKNKNGEVVFGVYQGGVRINVDSSSPTKGVRGGFAVGGLTNQGKASTNYQYFLITPDSTRVYINDLGKGARGGFAVGGLTNQSKSGTKKDYFKVTSDTSYFNTTVFTSSNIVSTGTVNTGIGVTTSDITYDGDTYKTVQIGTQTWMKENLRTLHFSDGTALSTDTVLTYNKTVNTDTINNFGRLYSYYVVTSPKNVCPDGWRIPSVEDWRTLVTFVGGANWQYSPAVAISSLKDTTSGMWFSSNIIGTNNSGFTARAAGYASYMEGWYFTYMGENATWWTNNNLVPMHVTIEGSYGGLQVGSEGSTTDARSIRCIKN